MTENLERFMVSMTHQELEVACIALSNKLTRVEAFLQDLLNGDVVFTGPSAERLRQQAADLHEPKQEIDV